MYFSFFLHFLAILEHCFLEPLKFTKFILFHIRNSKDLKQFKHFNTLLFLKKANYIEQNQNTLNLYSNILVIF